MIFHCLYVITCLFVLVCLFTIYKLEVLLKNKVKADYNIGRMFSGEETAKKSRLV